MSDVDNAPIYEFISLVIRNGILTFEHYQHLTDELEPTVK